MKKLFPVFLLFSPSFAYGFILDNAEFGVYNPNPSGFIRDVYQKDSISVDSDLHLSSKTSILANYSAENLPFIPDFRISYTKLHLHGSGLASKDFKYKDLEAKKGEPISSKWDFENISLTFYYQPINYFNNDYFKTEIGITTDFINSDFKIKNEKYGSAEDENIGAFIPTLHLYFEFQPEYYFSLYLNFEGLSFTDQKRKLFSPGIKYYINSQLYLNSGYKYEKIKVRDHNDTDFDITTRGYFFKVGIIW